MTGYEQDFIYKVLPRLTKAIEGLTTEIKRYNDNIQHVEENVTSKASEEAMDHLSKMMIENDDEEV